MTVGRPRSPLRSRIGSADQQVGEGRAKVLAALMHGGRLTISHLSDATGLNRSTVHTHLERLRDEGWCTWEDDQSATLRPTFECAWPAYMLKEARHGRRAAGA